MFEIMEVLASCEPKWLSEGALKYMTDQEDHAFYRNIDQLIKKNGIKFYKRFGDKHFALSERI